MDNKMIEYKDSFFSMIRNKILKMFKKTDNPEVQYVQKDREENDDKTSFKNEIKVEQNEDTYRIINLKNMYYNDEISEEEISSSDIDKLIAMYHKELAKVNREIQVAKNKI